MLGNDGCDEIHHRAYRWGFAQVAVNREPNIAREGWNGRIDADEIAVAVPEKAGQAGYTRSGPHGNQVFTDVI
jgi:hypothetical protein